MLRLGLLHHNGDYEPCTMGLCVNLLDGGGGGVEQSAVVRAYKVCEIPGGGGVG